MTTSTENLDQNLFPLLGARYLGTRALDELSSIPQDRQRGYCFVFNSDPGGLPGTHWMAICFPNSESQVSSGGFHNRSAIFIDPMNIPYQLLDPSIKTYLHGNSHRVISLPYAIQTWSGKSKSCGQYCAYILANLPYYRYDISGLITDNFSDWDFYYNDRVVGSWWETISAMLIKGPTAAAV